MENKIKILIVLSSILNIILLTSTIYLNSENNNLEDFSKFMISEYAGLLAAYDQESYNNYE